MKDYAVLSSKDDYTLFSFENFTIRFQTPKTLKKYTKVVKWDFGYLVVMAQYGEKEEEEYIDLIPILRNLYINVNEFLKPIREVRIQYA